MYANRYLYIQKYAFKHNKVEYIYSYANPIKM